MCCFHLVFSWRFALWRYKADLSAKASKKFLHFTSVNTFDWTKPCKNTQKEICKHQLIRWEYNNILDWTHLLLLKRVKLIFVIFSHTNFCLCTKGLCKTDVYPNNINSKRVERENKNGACIVTERLTKST